MILFPDWNIESFTFDVQIGNEKFIGFVDTGADDTAIKEESYIRTKREPVPVTVDVETLSGVKALPQDIVEIEFLGISRTSRIVISPRKFAPSLEKTGVEVLIGRRHLNKVVITIDSDSGIEISEKSYS